LLNFFDDFEGNFAPIILSLNPIVVLLTHDRAISKENKLSRFLQPYQKSLKPFNVLIVSSTA
jgi:hypothetical protein